MAGQLDRQVYGEQIEFAETRLRPSADIPDARVEQLLCSVSRLSHAAAHPAVSTLSRPDPASAMFTGRH